MMDLDYVLSLTLVLAALAILLTYAVKLVRREVHAWAGRRCPKEPEAPCSTDRSPRTE